MTHRVKSDGVVYKRGVEFSLRRSSASYMVLSIRTLSRQPCFALNPACHSDKYLFVSASSRASKHCESILYEWFKRSMQR